ncbi:MAG: hypothetical protein ABIG55_01095 [Candidatus Omnitrophota bacterium]
MRTKRFISLICAVLITVSFSLQAYCGDEFEGEERTVTKTITGKLCSRSPMAAPVQIGISLVDGSGKDMGRDVFFYVDKDMKLENKKEFIEINVGDVITVTYDETVRDTEDGKEELVKKVATKIRFVRAEKSSGTLSSKF